MQGIIAAILMAVTAMLSPSSHVSWTQQTCSAEQAWVHHPTMARLDTMATDSFGAPWRYVGEDAWSLVSDVRSDAPSKYVKDDEKYFSEDCS